jgi:hypothetical protein
VALMFIWPDGQVTGAEHWDALAWLLSEKPDESAYYADGRPSKAGWSRLEALHKEHYELVNPPQPEQSEADVADMETEADEQAAASRATKRTAKKTTAADKEA